MKNPTHGPAASVMEHLRRNASTGNVLPIAERFLELQRDVNQLLPMTIPEGCSVCQFEEGELSIAVPSATLASKLRQTLPRLREGLERRGWKVNAIQLRVQPSNSSYKSTAYKPDPKRALVPENALPHLSDLAESLQQSPLKDALNAMVRRRKP